MEGLERELARWHAQGRVATLWLRDDDAAADTPALRRLLALADDFALPVAIAAIPALLDDSLRIAIDACGSATIVQHGYAHRNHARPGERSAELAAGRDMGLVLAELAQGRETLSLAFAERFEPVLVPPWNRVAEALLPKLPDAQFVGLSRFGPRSDALAAPRLPQVNTHVDLVAWRRDRAFIGGASAVARIVEHLAGRREGRHDPDEPTGVLTHHLAFDADAFGFLRALLEASACHHAVRWLGVREVFAATSARSA